MKKKWIALGIGSLVVLSFIMWGSITFFQSKVSAATEINAYGQSLHGLNHDMRESLRNIGTERKDNDQIQILHDQLHLMKEILHLVKNGNEEDPHFRQLHDLNHGMRESWHELKKGPDKTPYLRALEDQLHKMKELLHSITGEREPHETSMALQAEEVIAFYSAHATWK